MRRADFLLCTGLSADQYTYMIRNRHLPYLDSERRGWAHYSARQVFCTAVAVALAPHVGGQEEAARRVVEIPHGELSRIWGALFHPELGDVFGFSYVTEDSSGRWRVEQVKWAFSLVSHGSALDLPEDAVGANALSLPTINLSAIMRSIRERGAAADISFDEDVDA